MKQLLLIPLLLLCSCHNPPKTINEKFDEAFNDSVIKSGAKLYDYHHFPDWKAKAYLKDKQIKLLHVISMGEMAYGDMQVYFTPAGRVEKIVKQVHYRDWKSLGDESELPKFYADTTLVFFPETGEKIKYDSEKRIELAPSDSLNAIYAIKSIDFYKERIEAYLK